MKQCPHQLPHAYWEEELKDLLAEGVIEPSQSNWTSPIVLVRNKDNSIRQPKVKCTVQNRCLSWPMPRIEDIIDKVCKAKFITAVDLARGYWQVPVADKDRHKLIGMNFV